MRGKYNKLKLLKIVKQQIAFGSQHLAIGNESIAESS